MLSASGRYVIAFNGEIYNHLALRQALANAVAWHSDTETLLAAVEVWGWKNPEEVCRHVRFALWDRQARSLTLARDRLGRNHSITAGREILSCLGRNSRHCALTLLSVPRSIGTALRSICAITAFLRLIRSIAISTNCPRFLADPGEGERNSQPRSYWSVREVRKPGSGTCSRFSGRSRASLEEVLRQAVADQMLADVPLGAFLSAGGFFDGGRAYADNSARPVQTFSIGFTRPATTRLNMRRPWRGIWELSIQNCMSRRSRRWQ